MKIEQRTWTKAKGWEAKGAASGPVAAQLVLVFGAPSALKAEGALAEVGKRYPDACVMGCSTAGEIVGTSVLDDSITTTAVEFKSTKIRGAMVELGDMTDSRKAGEELGVALKGKNLAHVFVLSDGLGVNGSELVQGVNAHLPKGVSVTGGLAGDGARFEETLVFFDGKLRNGVVVAVGLYGEKLQVGCGSLGGWNPFGPERVVTKSAGNVLYELDGRPALELYKTYLGEHSDGLPATGLLFPLSIHQKDGGAPLVRTILSVDEKEGSMTFAGDVPESSYARLMRTNLDRLIDGAAGAAKACLGVADPRPGRAHKLRRQKAGHETAGRGGGRGSCGDAGGWRSNHRFLFIRRNRPVRCWR